MNQPFNLRRGEPLGRYGENWDDRAWLFRSPPASGPDVAGAEVVFGPALGFNNYIDVNAGVDFVRELHRGGYQNPVVVIKHGKACGAATGEHAVERAYQGDPMNAFGGIWGFARRFELADAQDLCDRPNGIEDKIGWRRDVIFAPDFSGEAIDHIRGHEGKKVNTRLVTIPGLLDQESAYEMRPIRGGHLVQRRDPSLYFTEDGKIDGLFVPAYDRPTGKMVDTPQGKKPETRRVGVVTKASPPRSLTRVADFAVRLCFQEPSNATVIAREYATDGFQLVGYGIAEPGRSDSCWEATERSRRFYERENRIVQGTASAADQAILANEVGEMQRNRLQIYRDLCVWGAAATDSFFPFPDGLRELAKSRVTLVLHPGGSIRDQEVIAAADDLKMEMIYTGKRYFKHGDKAPVEVTE
ncbi:MAG: hypothetical protein HY369_03455 [Candidatus Aenigmarchaeota archaeon]|nr:hypothetical protein [Candidatus Aenigmarchaeota archaeon]